MDKRVRVLQDADDDIVSIILYIADDNPDAARRFYVAVQETSELLLEMPHIGSLRISDKPSLRDIRVVPIKDFERYFVFYRPMNEGIEIIRVLHGARDYPSLF